MKTKKTVKITIGIVCICVSVLLAVVLSFSSSGGSVLLTDVVVLTEEILPGEYITADRIGIARIPSDYASGLEKYFSDVQQCAGMNLRAAGRMSAGQILTESMCMSSEDPMEQFILDDLRLVSLEAASPAEGMVGQIEAGDVISVAFADEDGSYSLDDSLRYLRVYSLSDAEGHTAGTMEYLGEHKAPSDGQGTPVIVTVVCTEEQALLLARSANLQTRIIFAGRGPCSEALTAALRAEGPERGSELPSAEGTD